jgi:hypothetical protein
VAARRHVGKRLGLLHRDRAEAFGELAPVREGEHHYDNLIIRAHADTIRDAFRAAHAWNHHTLNVWLL